MDKSSGDKENCIINVTYKKSEDIADTIKYGNGKLIDYKFLWFSKQGRTLENNDVREIKNSQENKLNYCLYLSKKMIARK